MIAGPGLAAVCAVLLAALPGPPARADVADEDPCRASAADHPSFGAGPLPSGSAVADFGLVPEACPAFDVLARLRGLLLISDDAPDFYGNVAGGLLLRVRHPLERRTWLSLALETVTFRYVANASLRSQGFSLGPATLGVYHRLPLRFSGALAAYGRILLPLDTARDNSVETGGELGLSAWLPLRARVGVQGGVALPAPVTLTAGQAHGAFLPAAVAEAFWLPRPAIALTAGAAVRSQVLPERALRSLAARAAVQLSSRGGLRLALAAELPLFGDDRTDIAASVLVAWTSPGSRPAP